ncbi:hypothetical protein G6F50_014301 [Rhizopus delemar]|uniref:Uncharacterized protein n=1 Tax=Rhizopus delemar TaxID=936053 RepID=A0A9P6Y6U5_9FUNG|nr:hypothetical protein G6F50_014301 [Rhizopus delemar]
MVDPIALIRSIPFQFRSAFSHTSVLASTRGSSVTAQRGLQPDAGEVFQRTVVRGPVTQDHLRLVGIDRAGGPGIPGLLLQLQLRRFPEFGQGAGQQFSNHPVEQGGAANRLGREQLPRLRFHAECTLVSAPRLQQDMPPVPGRQLLPGLFATQLLLCTNRLRVVLVVGLVHHVQEVAAERHRQVHLRGVAFGPEFAAAGEDDARALRPPPSSWHSRWPSVPPAPASAGPC